MLRLGIRDQHDALGHENTGRPLNGVWTDCYAGEDECS
jgi:hypothetical protein